MVLWPEDVVNIEGPVTNSTEGAVLSRDRPAAPHDLIVGVVEGDGNRFHNAQVAIDPDGNFVDRYEKVHRVPFGEYVPLRSLLEPFAGGSLIERDALVGADPAILQTPAGTFGVSNRGRSSSPTGPEPRSERRRRGPAQPDERRVVPRVDRADPADRGVAVARRSRPAGGSCRPRRPGSRAIINPDGTVEQRTGISERRVLEGTVQRRSGETIATRVGDWPALILAFGLLALGWIVQLRGGSRVRSRGGW